MGTDISFIKQLIYFLNIKINELNIYGKCLVSNVKNNLSIFHFTSKLNAKHIRQGMTIAFIRKQTVATGR